jgi:hypothetical protein
VFEPRAGLTFYDGSLSSIIGHMIVQLHPDMGPKVRPQQPAVVRYWCPKDQVGWAGDNNRCWVCGRYTGQVNSLASIIGQKTRPGYIQ